MKKRMKGFAYLLCTTMVISTSPSWAVYAENGRIVEKTVQTAAPYEAERNTEDNEEVKEDKETREDLGSGLKTDGKMDEELRESTPSEAEEMPKDTSEILPTKIAETSTGFSSLGDIWDAWAGKTSFEFLSGNQGEGTKEKPFLIKNREQLMGLSELTAMGMMVPESGQTKYAGDYSGCYFALGGNIDLQGVNWIPIGFYRDSSENAGEVPYPFSGEFDGNGYIIKNLKLNSFASFNNVGLFGAVSDAGIHDVTIIPDSSKIKGKDRTGVVTGYAEKSKIRNVTVKNAYIQSTGIAGGIAGEISGTVIENAICEKMMIDATGGTDVIYVGGIAGVASDSYIVDSNVSTGDGTTARIQGTGYIGGIVGYQNAAYIYNTYVSAVIIQRLSEGSPEDMQPVNLKWHGLKGPSETLSLAP